MCSLLCSLIVVFRYMMEKEYEYILKGLSLAIMRLQLRREWDDLEPEIYVSMPLALYIFCYTCSVFDGSHIYKY